MNDKIAIIGASYLQLPLVKKANQLNLETHVFAWEEGSVAKVHADYFYPISITEKEKILEECRKIKPQGVVSIASDLATVTVNYIAKELNLTGNSLECTVRSRNKYLMRTAFIENGIKCPRFQKFGFDRIYDIDRYIFPLIVKPTDSSGSRGVNKVCSANEINDAYAKASKYSTTKEVILEEYIEGDEISVETISYDGKHYFLTATDKETAGPPHFVESAHHQPSLFLAKSGSEIRDLTFRGLDSLGIKNGAAHTEIKITPDNEMYIIETGARMGGDFIGSSLVELSTGYDYLKGVVDVSLGRFTEPVKTKNHFSGVYFICPVTSGQVKTINDNTNNYPQIIKKEIDLKEGDKVEPASNSLERKGYYIYTGQEKFLKKNAFNIKLIKDK